MNPFVINLLAALAGWAAWNILMMSMFKDANEETFSLKKYIGENWDNWLASLFLIPVLLYVGYNKLDLGVIGMAHSTWNDVYYVCSGFAIELIITAIKKFRSKA